MTRLLSQRLRNHRLFLLDGGEGGGSGSGGATATAEPPAPTGEPPAPAGDGKPTEPVNVSMTQAELDAHIKRAHAKGASAAEKKIGDYLANEALTGEQKITAERDAANQRAEAAEAAALLTRVEGTAERQALAAKVDPARVGRFMKLVDLADTTVDGKPDSTLIEAAVAKTLADFPEFAAGAPAPAGASGGEFGTNSNTKIWTRAEIAKLSTAEFDKHAAEIHAQTAQGLVK